MDKRHRCTARNEHGHRCNQKVDEKGTHPGEHSAFGATF